MTTTTNLIERLYEIGKNDDKTIAHQAASALEAQAKQIEALQAEKQESALKHVSLFGEMQEALDRIEALQADADRYRWLKNNCVLGIKQFGLGWSLSTRQGIAPDSLRDVDAAIDANRKGNV